MQPLGRMGLQTESHKQKEKVFKTKSPLFNRRGTEKTAAITPALRLVAR